MEAWLQATQELHVKRVTTARVKGKEVVSLLQFYAIGEHLVELLAEAGCGGLEGEWLNQIMDTTNRPYYGNTRKLIWEDLQGSERNALKETLS